MIRILWEGVELVVSDREVSSDDPMAEALGKAAAGRALVREEWMDVEAAVALEFIRRNGGEVVSK